MATATRGRKPVTKKTKKVATVKRTRPLLTPEQLRAEEKEYIKAGYKIVPGSLVNRGEDPKKEARFANKRSVEVRCATRGCGEVFRVATSDLHQKQYCDECTLKMRAERKNEARRAATKKGRRAKAK